MSWKSRTEVEVGDWVSSISVCVESVLLSRVGFTVDQAIITRTHPQGSIVRISFVGVSKESLVCNITDLEHPLSQIAGRVHDGFHPLTVDTESENATSLLDIVVQIVVVDLSHRVEIESVCHVKIKAAAVGEDRLVVPHV